MPTISFSYEDLCRLVGRKLDESLLVSLLSHAKAELEHRVGDELTVQLNDTNQPYLWSVEGIARLLRGLLGKELGLAIPDIKKSKHSVILDKRALKVRPFISCFIAHGQRVDDYVLKQLIQLQEKLAENFGQKRKKISIGVYPLEKISFPVYLKAVEPSTKFTPLDFHQDVSLKRVLDEHPKGKEYGHLLKDESLYPVFIDSKKEILSLVPIINSESSGRLEVGSNALFFDTTGLDEESVSLVANIFAFALLDRGFTVESVTMEYPKGKVVSPSFECRKIKVDVEQVESLLGIPLKDSDLKSLLEKMRLGYSKGVVTIPSYRNDVMHPVDIVEDVAIAYGYDKLSPLPLKSFTKGGLLPIQSTIDTSRDLLVGLGYQEVMSPVLSNRVLLIDRMGVSHDVVEIDNPISQTYGVVRSWLLPILLDVLSKNKHVEFPQRIFEEGLVTRRDGSKLWDEERICGVTTHCNATFTEAKQALDFVLRMLNVSYSVRDSELACFVPGRGAQVLVDDVVVGWFGEINPSVLENFGLVMPVASFELVLSALKK